MSKVKVVFLCFGIIMFVKVLDFILAVFAYAFNPTMVTIPSNLGWILTIITWMILTGLYVYLRKRGKFAHVPSFSKINMKQFVFVALFALSINLLFNAARMLLFHLVADEAMMNQMREISSGFLDGNYLLLILSTVIIAPAAEEYLFRGIIFKRLSTQFNIRTAIIMQAVLFMIFHNNVGQFLFAFLLGLFLAYLMYVTNNLMIVVLFHMISNALTLLVNSVFMDMSGTVLVLVFLIGAVGIFYSTKMMRNKIMVKESLQHEAS